MALDPLAVGFRDRVRQVVVRIMASWVESGEKKGTLASGFFVTTGQRRWSGDRYGAIATARHVIVDRPTTRVDWEIAREVEGEPRVVHLPTHGLIELDPETPFIRPDWIRTGDVQLGNRDADWVTRP
ncbi:MAG: hypothetical protein V3T84_05220 [Phycisphaerales bacterium]